MFEIYVNIECPFCSAICGDHGLFDLAMACNAGVNSKYQEATCFECNKDFYFKTYCSFEAEVVEVRKRKPKDLE